MRYPFFICFLLLSALVSGQTIHGTIIDQKTNLPIPDVHVQWVNSLGTISNPQGKFELRKVKGINTIRVSAIGYTTHEEIIGDDSIRIALEPSALMLNQGITITAHRQEDLT
ncbi:MAG: carboxypeptidase-like regulatory domain-containing protein, partial [Cyclobacteriaceae bacterium]